MKICLISNSAGTWTEQDAQILKELGHQVKQVVVEATFGPYRILRLLLEVVQPAQWSDVLFCWFAFPAGFVGVILGKLLRKFVIVNAVGIDVAYVPEIKYGLPLKSHWRGLLKWTLSNAGKVIAISEESANNVKKIVTRDVEIIYEGIDVRKFRPIKVTEPEQNLILTVGILSKANLKRKGFETLVKCIPHVVKEVKNTKFVFVGRRSDGYRVLRNLADKLGVLEYVDFAGFKSDEELLTLLNKCTVFAMPSIHEGFPTVISEALACEKPVVSTALSAISEVVVNNETGILISEPQSPRELAEALLMLLANPILRKKMGKRGRERIVQEFSKELRTQRIRALLAYVNNQRK